MRRSAFVKGTGKVQNEKHEERALRLRDDFLKLAGHVGWGEYETWIVKLHLAFLRFCEDIEDYLEPQEYGTVPDELKDWVNEHLRPDPPFDGNASRSTGLPKSMTPDGKPNVEAIRSLRVKYPRVWWLWDHAERTGHVQMIPRPYLWERGGADIPVETKMAILVYPDTTEKDLERQWQSVKRLKDKIYRGDPYPRSKTCTPLEKWPIIVAACEDDPDAMKENRIGSIVADAIKDKDFKIDPRTVWALYKKAFKFVFCGPPKVYRKDDRPPKDDITALLEQDTEGTEKVRNRDRTLREIRHPRERHDNE